jgi:hypothetical protein
MKKKKQRELPKTATSLEELPKFLHVALPMELSHREIQIKVGGNKHFRATCSYVGCGMRYAYTGKNPLFCPDHVNGRWNRERNDILVKQELLKDGGS